MQLLIVCNLSYVTMGSSSCMCWRNQKISCIRQLQNDSFLLVKSSQILKLASIHIDFWVICIFFLLLHDWKIPSSVPYISSFTSPCKKTVLMSNYMISRSLIGDSRYTIKLCKRGLCFNIINSRHVNNLLLPIKFCISPYCYLLWV
jgi:hypothetical protein